MLKRYAQEIAESTARVVGYDVFITDEKGIIIGCSDASRGRGSLHEASLRAINSRRGFLENEEDARKFRGTKPGCTYPIADYNGRIVGTIAMTGDPQKVKPFALIVRKHAEMLLREKELVEMALNRERNLQSLFSDISLFNPDINDETALLRKARNLGFAPELRYVAIALEFSPQRISTREGMRQHPLDHSIRSGMLMEIKSVFDKAEDIAAPLGENRYAVLRSVYKDTDGEDDIRETLLTEYDILQKLLKEKKTPVAMGIGRVATGISEVARSYREAWHALLSGKKLSSGREIYFIEEYKLEELLLTSTPSMIRQFVLEELAPLENISSKDEMYETILTWCDSGFNLNRAAKRLHIHRSTLDYRLDRIGSLCHIDPRCFRSSLRLYTAIELKRLTGTGKR